MAEKGTGGKNKIGFDNDALDYGILAVIVVAIIGALLGPNDVNDVPQLIQGRLDLFFKPTLGLFTEWLKLHSVIFKAISMGIIIFSIAAITYILINLIRVRRDDYEKYKALDVDDRKATARQVAWAIILQHISSENSAEWKLGILEADNILDELLEERGYRGENLGERLKFAETKGLATINDAWEAHRARNKLVHEEAILPINKRDARKIIDAYERVFKELGYL